MPVLRICVPAKVYTNTKFTMCLLTCMNQIKPRTGYDPDIKFMCGKSNIDQARSMLTTDFYNQCNKDDIMLFIDSDHIFQIDDICNAIAIGGDVACGIYPNAIGNPTCYMMNPDAFLAGTDNRLRYAGTGFMLIRHTTLTRVAKWLADNDTAFARVSGDDYNKVVPFFKQRIVPTEFGPANCGVKDWLGEDYTFCWLVRQCECVIRGFFTKTLGHEVVNIRVFYPESSEAAKKGPLILNQLPVTSGAPAPAPAPAAPQVVVPVQPKSTAAYEVLLPGMPNTPSASTTIVKNDSQSVPDIVYFCGNSRVQFCPTTSGLGGSEQAVVGLSRRWAELGRTVHVYGNVFEGVYDGVQYFNVSKFDLARQYRIVILWRGFGLQILPTVKADHLFVDLHDPTAPELLPVNLLERVERIFVKSNWHTTIWTHLPESIKSKFTVIPNGIDVKLLDQVSARKILRNEHKICYTSCYTRGLLEILKRTWPQVRAAVPYAELHLCYGDDLIADQSLKQSIREAMKQPGVVDHGRLSAEKVFELRASCGMQLYLCTTPKTEIDCLSVREAWYGGCVPIVFDEGVFKERHGVRVPTVCTDPNGYNLAATAVVKLIRDPTLLCKLRDQPRNELTWSTVGSKWLACGL